MAGPMGKWSEVDGGACRFCRDSDAELIVPAIWDNGFRILPSVDCIYSFTNPNGTKTMEGHVAPLNQHGQRLESSWDICNQMQDLLHIKENTPKRFAATHAYEQWKHNHQHMERHHRTQNATWKDARSIWVERDLKRLATQNPINLNLDKVLPQASGNSHKRRRCGQKSNRRYF